MLQAKNLIPPYLERSHFRPFKIHMKAGHHLSLRLFLTPVPLDTIHMVYPSTTLVNIKTGSLDTLYMVYPFKTLVTIQSVLPQKHLFQPNLGRTMITNYHPTFWKTWTIPNFQPEMDVTLTLPH